MSDNEEAFNSLGETVDTLENLLAAMTMPIDPRIHLEALREELPKLKEKIKQSHLALGGPDYWT